jgi:hypothetical protein
MREVKLLLLLALAGPVFGGWAYKGAVTFPAASGSTTLTNWTGAFTATNALLKTVGNGGAIQNTVTHVGVTVPADFALTSDSTCTTITGFSWGIEYYEGASTGIIKGWAKMTLTTGAAIVPTVCVGNSAVSTYQGGAQGSEWDSNTVAAYHFPDGTTLGLQDFSANAHNMTDDNVSGHPCISTAGKVDGAITLNSPNPCRTRAVNGSTFPSANNPMTGEIWINPTVLDSNFRGSMSWGNISVTCSGVAIWTHNTSFLVGCAGQGVVPSITISTGTWYHVAFTYDGTNQLTYVNGALVAGPTARGYFIDGSFNFFVMDDGFSEFANSVNDEARVSSVARSGDWILQNYTNQNSPPAMSSLTAIASNNGVPAVIF